jgi:hypothetical protein
MELRLILALSRLLVAGTLCVAPVDAGLAARLRMSGLDRFAVQRPSALISAHAALLVVPGPVIGATSDIVGASRVSQRDRRCRALTGISQQRSSGWGERQDGESIGVFGMAVTVAGSIWLDAAVSLQAPAMGAEILPIVPMAIATIWAALAVRGIRGEGSSRRATG